MAAQPHRQRYAGMRIVVSRQIADDHLLVLLQRKLDNVDHEIDAGHHDLVVTTIRL